MKKIFKGFIVLLIALVLIAGGYAAYLFADYHRIEDIQELPCTQRREEALKVGEELSIVTWNLGFGAYNDDFDFFMDGGTRSRPASGQISQSNIQTAIEALKTLDADLILLQEVDIKGRRSYDVNQEEMIENAFADSHSSVFAQNYDSSFLFYPFHDPIGANQSGILTLAEARMDGASRHSLPVEGGVRKFLDLDRCYSVSRIPTSDGKQLSLFNLHLSAYTADGTIATEQLELMLEHMRRELDAGCYVIAGGDFNKDLWGDSTAYTGVSGEEYSWAQPFPAELLDARFSLVDSCNPGHPVLSCRDTGAPYEKGVSFEVTLDGFIVSDNVKVLACDVIDEGFRVTDHNPVKLEFVLAA